jgi:GT2 family glycosyltransferase
MKLSIIIVSFNTKQLTLECIKSIHKFAPNFSYEIVVVDNASTDGSAEILRKLEKVTFIQNKKNYGFSKANNIGMRAAKGEYFLLLNSDTLITNPIFEKLVNFADSCPDAGVIAPRLLNTDGSTQASIFRLPTLSRAIFQYWLGKQGILDKYAVDTGDEVIVESVVGAVFLITPKARKAVGLLDEKYFMYFEDLDYCRQIRLHDLKIYYLPQVVVVHHHGASGNSSVSSLLIDSSKKYFGTIRYYLYTFVLWSGQKLHHK